MQEVCESGDEIDGCEGLNHILASERVDGAHRSPVHITCWLSGDHLWRCGTLKARSARSERSKRTSMLANKGSQQGMLRRECARLVSYGCVIRYGALMPSSAKHLEQYAGDSRWEMVVANSATTGGM